MNAERNFCCSSFGCSNQTRTSTFLHKYHCPKILRRNPVFEREPEFSPLRLANDPPRLSGRPRPRVVSRTSSETICGQNEKFSPSGDSGTRNAVGLLKGKEGHSYLRNLRTHAHSCFCMLLLIVIMNEEEISPAPPSELTSLLPRIGVQNVDG